MTEPVEMDRAGASSFARDIDVFLARQGRSRDWTSTVRAVVFSPGLHFLAAHRLVVAAGRLPVVGRVVKMVLWTLSCHLFRSEIAVSTVLGAGCYVPHPYGIVIGRAVIGEGVQILQNVTIGAARRDDGGCPVIGAGVVIGAGAVILGEVEVGDGAVIGANAVVVGDVPAGCTAVGVPAKVIDRSPRRPSVGDDAPSIPT